MNNDARITKSSGNIYEDMGLPDADELFFKAQLGFKIYSLIKERNWSQKEAAEFLSVDESEISPLLNCEFSDYNVEQLFSFLNRLGHNVDVYVTPAQSRETHQQLHAAD